MSNLFIKFLVFVFVFMAIASAYEKRPGLFLYALGAAILNVGILQGFK